MKTRHLREFFGQDGEPIPGTRAENFINALDMEVHVLLREFNMDGVLYTCRPSGGSLLRYQRAVDKR